MRFQPVQIHIEEGDIIVLKKGMLQKSEITDEYFLVTKAKYCGGQYWESIKKESIKDVKVVK